MGAAAIPCLLSLVVAGLLALAGPVARLRFTVPVTTLIVVVGILTSLLVAAGLAWRWWWDRRRRQLLEDGASDARAEHVRFVSRLEHEMKNPLTAIRTSLAAHGNGASAHLEVAEAQAVRLGGLVGDLRKVAGLRDQPLEPAQVDLRELADDAVAAVRENLAAAGSSRELLVHFPSAPWHIPPVWGDPDLLYLAVFNLIANAAKFTAEGDSVEIRASERDGFVTLEVADTGLGIPQAALATVWEELGRAPNAHGIPGSGLGLPLVRIVVERHGGSVNLRSREGSGTSVMIVLPVAPGHPGHRPG